MNEQTDNFAYRPWLHRFAVSLVLVTFALVILGGTVTSKGVGLSVPDWPNSFGHNMFLFPPSMWHGGIFWEHTHRLLGSLVGLLSIILAVWLWVTQKARPGLRWLGMGVLALVIIQGVMGGLRVTELSLTLAIIHGITGQLFLCSTVAIAAATSAWWIAGRPAAPSATPASAAAGRLRLFALLVLLAAFLQLVLGAVTRHTGAGLAIPDFPAMYGGLVPPLSAAAIHQASDRLPYDNPAAFYPTVAQVAVHFAHRLWAVVLAALLVSLLAAIAKVRGPHGLTLLRGPMLALLLLLVLQVALGAAVIWSARRPDMATAHQATGAAFLATLVLLTLRLGRVGPPMPARAPAGLDDSSAADFPLSQEGAV